GGSIRQPREEQTGDVRPGRQQQQRGGREDKQQPQADLSRIDVAQRHELNYQLRFDSRLLRVDEGVQDGFELTPSLLEARARPEPDEHSVIPALVLELPYRWSERLPDIDAIRERKKGMEQCSRRHQ